MKTRNITSEAMLIFRIALPLILTVLVGNAMIMSSLDTYERILHYPVFVSTVEHALMALLITVGGAFLLDISVRRRSR